ncbi:MAG: hypothetical protein WD042_00605 [Phycisphaeraceae bacterium]
MHLQDWLSGVSLLAVMLVTFACVQGEVVIREVADSAMKADRVVPWCSADDDSWHAGKPLFRLADGQTGLTAEGRAAVSNDSILLQVIVHDRKHVNKQSGAGIWNGDAIQVGLDARGDGAGRMPRQTRALFGPDDMALTVALTDSGPAGFTHYAGNEAMHGKPMPRDCVAVTRDEKAGTTRYDVRIPWAMLNTVPGMFPTLGMAVQVNDTNGEAPDQTRLYFGRGADAMPRPGQFERIGIGEPKGERVGALATSDVIWNGGDRATIAVVVASSKPHVIQATLGDAEQTFRVAGDGRTHRFLVEGRPDPGVDAGALKLAAVVSPDGQGPVAQASVPVIVPDAVYRETMALVSAAAERADHDLLKRHLNSIKAIIQTEWARQEQYGPSDPTAAQVSLVKLMRIRDGFLNDDVAQWSSYYEGRRELVFAFLSRRDGTLQHYVLGLPKNWDPAKAYPLFLELHGSGSTNPLFYVARQVGGAWDKSNLMRDEDGDGVRITYAGIQRNGYHLRPFGRGNTGYRDIGEVDVWEAMADFDAVFKTDPDRRYLYGFSMGGGGTWRLATHTPDQWAAIAMFSSGGGSNTGNEGLGRNVAKLPIWLWCGEEDRLLRNTLRLRDQITKYGNNLVFSLTPGVGHRYIDEKQMEAINWMQQHTRKRPDEFEFVVDTDEHRGIWGITVQRDLTVSGLPDFKARIAGNTVDLVTHGTPSVTVNAGDGGLGLSGDVKIVLNGAQVYAGPAKTIVLPVDAMNRSASGDAR